jgi:hypothetical protein
MKTHDLWLCYCLFMKNGDGVNSKKPADPSTGVVEIFRGIAFLWGALPSEEISMKRGQQNPENVCRILFRIR